jgi:two-component system response regulator DesR
VQAILAPEPDLETVGSAADEEQVWSLLRRTRPSVVVLDLYHPGRDGLRLSLKIKRRPYAPAVVLYSASTDPALGVAAAVAGANAIVRKSEASHVLVEAIREVARAPRTLPSVSPRIRAEAAAMLDSADHAILAMRLAGHSPANIAATLVHPVHAIAERIAAIVTALVPPTAPRSENR